MRKFSDVLEIPAQWSRASVADEALSELPIAPGESVAILSGFVHSQEEYDELFDACLQRNYRLINSPEDYQRCHTMDAAYPYLRKFTPTTFAIESIEKLPQALKNVGLPVFIKGGVQSRKDRGWKHCVAHTAAEAKEIAASLFNSYTFSAGKVILREMRTLRAHRSREDGFPVAREFRVLLFENEPLGVGYYWPDENPQMQLAPQEREAVLSLATKASEALGVRYVVIDIAQEESGNWIVIEPGDPQSAGLPNLDLEDCFGRLVDRLGCR